MAALWIFFFFPLPYVTVGIREEGCHGAYKQLITTGFIYIL